MGSDFPRRNALIAMAVAAAIAQAQTAQAQSPPTPPVNAVPQPCVAGTCAGHPGGFVSAGSASAVQSGSNLTVNQASANATLNWRSFNVGSQASVKFQQPDASSIALNRIHDTQASAIFGSLNANGRVFLINRNGILFGEGAQVNVGGLLASSLDMTPQAAELGIGRAWEESAAAFSAFRDADGNKLQSGQVTIEQGANVNALGGQVLVFAPEVHNRGTIKTPDGQTILAAGESIYLRFLEESSDLRGLLVEIDTGDTASGIVTNGSDANAGQTDPARLAGQILAERGNVTLAGLVVNQQGRVSATTSVRSNGSIRLMARDGGSATPQGILATRGGTANVGSNSSTTVTLDRNDQERTVDVNAQPRSSVTIEGARVNVQAGSDIVATAGVIDIAARSNLGRSTNSVSDGPDESRLYIAPGARLDVSGASVDLPVDRNVIAVELRGSQLADSPLQRDGELRSERVYVDIRASGTRADGSTWRGTPLADVSGDISTISRTVQERSLNGGSIKLHSHGDVLVSGGSTLDLSGGHINYQDGFVRTSRLLGDDGRVYDMTAADPSRQYTRILNGAVVQHERWGVTQNFGELTGRFESGYVEGKDAGSLQVFAPNVVLDGNVRAETMIGTYQRQAPQSLAAGMTRPYNQRPLGGELVLGNVDGPQNGLNQPDYLLPQVGIEPGAVLPELRAADGTAFDPLTDTLLPLGTVRLRPEILAEGVSRLRVATNGAFSLAEEASLDLGLFGSLDVIAGNAVIAGNIVAPSGSVRLTARETAGATQPVLAPVDIAATATIDVSGRWINDDPLLNSQGLTTPLAHNGGSVSLSGLTVNAASGSRILADGGAWRRADGSFNYGTGGRITVTAPGAVGVEPALTLDGELHVFAFQRGGTLNLSTDSLCVSDLACSGPEGSFRVGSEWFMERGFENLSLEATAEDLIVEPDANVRVRQRNLVFTGAVRQVESGTRLDTIARVETLPDQQRRPANLTLTARAGGALLTQEYRSDTLQDAPELLLSANSSFSFDPRAVVSLNSNARMRLDGAIHAPGGSITATLPSSLNIAEFIGSQGIWLGDRAWLDASGVPRITVGSTGLRTGEVLDGGSVSLIAQRGSITMAPDSVIDVSGTQAELDLAVGGIGSGQYQATRVASAGGDIVLTSAEGIYANATLRAASGEPGRVEGGSISVTLDAGQRGNEPVDSPFPGDSRRIEVHESLAPVVVEYGAAPSATLNGRALISASALRDSGADSLALTSRNVVGVIGGQPTLRSAGRVVFNGDVRLAPRSRLALEAAVLESNGGRASIDSAYVSLGNSDASSQTMITTPAAGSGTLEVAAGLIDVIGQSHTSGFANVSLSSRGDVRLRGVQGSGSGFAMPGYFGTSGTLRLQARQVYPTTLSTFTLETLAAGEGRPGAIQIDRTAGEAGDVYSAGGSLTLRADRIENRGALRAPFGSLSLQAEDIVLESGSLVSTSADGLLIPFGNTQGGFDWTYTLPDLKVIEYGPEGRPLPSQAVSLDADRIDFRAGATVDVSGGGDLQAWEFVPGPTGSRDILRNDLRPNQFAILPTASLAYAPYDAAEVQGLSALPGDSIEIPAGMPGIAAGTYALLPARYALLPGAMLVTAVSGYTDLAPGQSLTRLDGSVVIGARRTVAGTSLGDARTSGFAIQPGRYARLEARYDLTRASSFFASDRFADAPDMRLPGDAGSLTLTPRERLTLQGSLSAAGAGAASRGAAVQLAAENLRIVSAPATSPVEGEVAVLASGLDRLRPESLILGARLQSGAEATTVEVVANSVEIDRGVRLSAPVLLLAARDTVQVGSGAVLSAVGSGGDAADLALNGDAALLYMASSGGLAELQRNEIGGATGNVLLDEGATLRTAGSVRLDASRSIGLESALDVDGAGLALGAPQIAIGDAPAEFQGLVLDQQLADSELRELELSSRQTIDVFSQSSLRAREVTLHTPGIRGMGADANLTLESERLHLENPYETLETIVSGDGELRIDAGGVELGEGDFALAGFDTSTLNVSGDVMVVGDGSLASGGDLRFGTRQITGDSGVDYRFSAAGALQLDSAATHGFVPQATQPGFGSRLGFAAGSIDLDTRILAPAGRVDLQSSADVNLLARALVDVSGQTVRFDSVPVSAPGGIVRIASLEGDVTTSAGSRIDVSASEGGRAGRIEVLATRGTTELSGDLSGAATASGLGGEFQLDALNIAGFDDLIAALGDGHFDSSLSIRQRGAGNLEIAAGRTLRAHEVRVAADAGGVTVAGNIDARGASGGLISLYAQDDVTLSGQLLASASDADRRGGRVRLGSETGGIDLRGGSLIDVSAGSSADEAAAGSLELRVSRAALGRLLDSDPSNDSTQLRGTVRGHRLTTLEGFAVHNDVDGRIVSLDTQAVASNPLFASASSFMSQADALAAVLGRSADSRFEIRPGIEIRAANNLVLSTNSHWNLATWRFGDAPGVLTLRAGNDLRFDASLSDGFNDHTPLATLTTRDDSWSYRLVAGADFDAADPLGLLDFVDLQGRTGNFEIGAGTSTTPRVVRTGSGGIDVAAAGNIRMASQASVLYTAGIAGDGIPLGGIGGLGNRAYPIRGGDITLRAGGDIVGTHSNQLVTEWLWRTGRLDGPGVQNPQATGWTVNHGRFEQGVGALGGGNLTIRAGGDIDRLSAVIPSIGRQVGGTAPDESRVEVDGGGVLDVRADGSIKGGSYYIGLGSAFLSAGDDVAAGTSTTNPGYLPAIALGDATVEVVARRSLGVGAIVNPTLLPRGRSQGSAVTNTFFSTYSEESRVSFTAVGGDLGIDIQESRDSDYVASLSQSMLVTGNLFQLRLAPPQARFAALRGDLSVQGNLTQYPGAHGNLDLFAYRDLRIGGADASEIIISDADPEFLPSIDQPARDAVSTLGRVLSSLAQSSGTAEFNAAVPVHRTDTTPSRIVALQGDLQMVGDSQIYSAEPMNISAGRDALNLSFRVQNVSDASVTRLSAGRDVTYPLIRNTGDGSLRAISGEMRIDGPGQFVVTAGRDVDLQTSAGISTWGNSRNLALPDTGAHVSITAGLAGRVADHAAFSQKYLVTGTLYDAALREYVARVTGEPANDKATALARFADFTPEQRAAFLEQVLLAEVRAGGRSAATPGPGFEDYSRAFTAIETFYPGSNPDLDEGEVNPYSGDIKLFFSRIYTLDGGNISLFAPGGEINAGLAAPPVSFGLTKAASDLGVVVQSSGSVNAMSYGDLQVNESRVFAADGGNILVWSTRGDIDAGRGAKTAISAPAPTITFDSNGQAIINFPAALTGSGIQTLATSAGTKPGDVDLYAPRGVVNAGDAGIVAGNLTIGATAVLGANNITVSGVAVGVPVDAGGLAAGLSGLSNVASAGSDAATAVVDQGAGAAEKSSPLASAALSWLDVFVEGFGDEVCKADDVDCLTRQRNN